MKWENIEVPPQSSANVVSYDLRPAKQSERKMMIDSFLAAMEAGFSMPSYRYVGMGANRFYDFVMMYKYLGITRMISLEHDPKMFLRAVFNKPFHFISIYRQRVHDFLLEDKNEDNSIYWIDYDGGIDAKMTNDIASLGTNAVVGDFVFVTSRGEVPRHLSRASSATRLSELRDLLGPLAGSLTKRDVEDASFPIGTLKILRAAFSRAFSGRPDGIFRPFFRVRYADSTEMVSYGGVFDEPKRCGELLSLLDHRMPFLRPSGEDVYNIVRLDLTEKERRLFDLAVTNPAASSIEISRLYGLGFRQKQIDRYRELLRYHPRYVETLI